jgi:hypothetical protein
MFTRFQDVPRTGMMKWIVPQPFSRAELYRTAKITVEDIVNGTSLWASF